MGESNRELRVSDLPNSDFSRLFQIHALCKQKATPVELPNSEHLAAGTKYPGMPQLKHRLSLPKI